MASKGYTNQYLVADAIGRHDGVPPVAMLDVLIEAAENWIDAYTEETWLVTSVTAELHMLNTWPPTSYSHYRSWGGIDQWEWANSTHRDAVITLGVTPATAVTAVRARGLYVGAPVTTLPTTDYELLDPSLGQLLVAATWFAQQLSIDYTVNTPLPADIKYAATLLVAAWVMPMLNAGLSIDAGIQSYQIGTDLQVTFRDKALGVPEKVTAILDNHTNVLIGF